MKYRITASNTRSCSINLPASKSISNRAMIINALAGSTQVYSDNQCDDTRVMLQALSTPQEVIDVHHAGTAMRFLTAYCCTQPGERVITGSPRMQQRPIGILVDALRQVGAEVAYTDKEGYPPLRITGGKLQGGKVTMRGDVSSQFISAILMIAPYMTEGLQLTITGNILSLPYIKMTISMMRYCGAEVHCKDNTIEVAPTPYQRTFDKIDRDWSAASYWYEIAYLNSLTYNLNDISYYLNNPSADFSKVSQELNISLNDLKGMLYDMDNTTFDASEMLENLKSTLSDLNRSMSNLKSISADLEIASSDYNSLNEHPIQGDQVVAKYFKLLGIDTHSTASGVTISHNPESQPMACFRLNLSNNPDLAPTIIIGCLLKNQPFYIEGLDNLCIKECDRIEALQSEARKLGYILSQPCEGCLEWSGERCEVEYPIVIDTHNDHRMAMAFAPAALVFDEIIIDKPQVVSKSYPNFWNDLQEAGFTIETLK